MAQQHELSVMVLVKAAPVVTDDLQENMCVAGMELVPEPRWIRLHPVPFRDLSDDSKFRKYQEVNARAIRPSGDRRPESWTPIRGSIKPGRFLEPEGGWAARRERVAALGERTTCDLIARNRSGSGPDTPSLAVVRAAGTPELLIARRDDKQLRRWQQRAEAIAAQSSLFDDDTATKPPFEVVPWRFSYHYRCLEPSCNGHEQTIIDWEAVTLWRRLRHRDNWQDLMRGKFVDELWAPDRDTVLFVGNQNQHPQSFLVLGVFWPPRGDFQTSLP